MPKIISEEIKSSIISEYTNGTTMLELSLMYNISTMTVGKIVKDVLQPDRNKTNKAAIIRNYSEPEEDENLIKAKDNRKIKVEVVQGKKMYDIFDFLFQS